MIHRPPFFLPLIFPTLRWREQTHERKLFLTFDDGPMPEITDFVLETLETFNVSGVFFVIGDNVRKHPETFGKIIQRGHGVGNHTFNHVNGWKTATQDYLGNVERCREVLKQEHSDTSLFRPPYGRITPDQVRKLKSSYRIIMWDVLTRDYDAACSPESCLRATIRYSRPGSIIVFHDSHKASRNLIYTLPRFIAHALEAGYAFDKIQTDNR